MRAPATDGRTRYRHTDGNTVVQGDVTAAILNGLRTLWVYHAAYRNSLCSAGVASPAADSSRMSRLPKLVILYCLKRQLMPFPPKGIQKLFTEGLLSILDKEYYCSHATSLR